MTPLYILLSSIGIRHTLLGLIVVYAAIAMPFCIWNMRAAFASISREVEESAQLDGASFLQTFFAISLPLAAPAIAVAALVAFLAGYTEFAIGWLFIEDSRSVTLAMSLWGLLSQLSWSEISALAILMSLPVVVLFVILQNTITDRFLVGLNQE